MSRKQKYFLTFLTSCVIFVVSLILFGTGNEEEFPKIVDFSGSRVQNTQDYDWTKLYWDRRNDSASSASKLFEILSTTNLWRPTDEFTGSWDQNYDDRILAQLIWTEAVQPSRKKVIGLAEEVDSWYVTKEFVETEIRQRCPNLVLHCQYLEMSTSNQSAHFDAILTRQNRMFSPELSSTRGIYTLESSMHMSGTINKRDMLISFWRGSDIAVPYGKWVYYNSRTRSKQQDRNYAAGKTKMAAIFVSNCSPANNRLGFVHELKRAGLEVDIYGMCGNLSCPSQTSKSCFEKLAKDYKFYLAFENSNCRDYITEKFFLNALTNDVLPVVMGAHPDDYKAAAPLNSYIHIDDFPNAAAIVAYLLRINTHDDEYNKFFQWKGTGEFVNHVFFCRFCAMLYYGEIVPHPVRSQVLNWEWDKQEQVPKNRRPCLPRNQIHWPSSEEKTTS